MEQRKQIAAGVYKSTQLSIEDYHKDLAIGSSGIKEFLQCPAIYYARYRDDKAPRRKLSQSMQFGSHAHLILLEPEKFYNQYKVAPKTYIANKGKSNEQERLLDNKTCSGWKNFEKECKSESKIAIFEKECKSESKIAILDKELESFAMMAAMIEREPLIKSMLFSGIRECSFFAEDKTTGLMLKARPDVVAKVPNFGNVIVDYKTTDISLNDASQANVFFNLRRYIQAAHHKRVVELATKANIRAVCYVVQMSSYPYLVRAFAMQEEHIKAGNDEIDAALPKIKQCEEKGEWPGYSSEITYLEAPAWWHYKYN